MKKFLLLLTVPFIIGCVASQPTKKTVNKNLEKTNLGPIYDRTTGLMWASMDNGQGTCWRDAYAYAENYREGGFTDWRLPTMEELSTIFDEDKKRVVPGQWYSVRVTPEIHLSAGAVVAADEFGATAGYIYRFTDGTHTFGSKTAISEHLRALPVRTAGFYIPAPPKKNAPVEQTLSGAWRIDGIEENGQYTKAKPGEDVVMVFSSSGVQILIAGESIEKSMPTGLGRTSHSIENDRLILRDTNGERFEADIDFSDPESFRLSNYKTTQKMGIVFLSIRAAMTGRLVEENSDWVKHSYLYFKKNDNTKASSVGGACKRTQAEIDQSIKEQNKAFDDAIEKNGLSPVIDALIIAKDALLFF